VHRDGLDVYQGYKGTEKAKRRIQRLALELSQLKLRSLCYLARLDAASADLHPAIAA
jgi:hypothetical protein